MSDKLFDFDESPEESEEKHVDEGVQFDRDKIFNNDYNTGNLDFEEFNIPQVESFYAEKNLEDCYNSHEYERDKNLHAKIDVYFIEGEFYELLKEKKKIPKQNIPLVFVSIREQFKGNDYSDSEIFSAFAEYFSMNYEILYENVPAIYREALVKELDQKYGILKKRGIQKLF